MSSSVSSLTTIEQASREHQECIRRWGELRKRDGQVLETMHDIDAHFPPGHSMCIRCGPYMGSFYQHIKTEEHGNNRPWSWRR